MVQKESPIPSSSDKSHVIRTTAQWNSSGDQYHVIPRGVLCIELTSNGKTKIKVGEGNKCYSQLPYISDMEDLSNYYTKVNPRMNMNHVINYQRPVINSVMSDLLRIQIINMMIHCYMFGMVLNGYSPEEVL